MELEDKDERTFEDFLAFLQLHPELKTWEIGPEPILSLPGLQIYPDPKLTLYLQYQKKFIPLIYTHGLNQTYC